MFCYHEKSASFPGHHTYHQKEMTTTKTPLLKTTGIALLALMCFGGAALAAEKDGMTLEAGYFKPELKFKAHYANGRQTNQSFDVDFKKDLGFPDKNAAEYRLWVSDRVRLSYARWDFGAHRTLTETISYGGSTYNIGGTVDSALDIHYYRLTYMKPAARTAAINIDWLLDIKGFRFKTAITGLDSVSGLTKTADKDFQGAVPTVGARITTRQDKTGLSGYGEFSGIQWKKYGYLYDWEAGVKYRFDKHAALTVAYRSFDINVNDGKADADRARLKQSGPYFQLDGKF